jgi:2-polyprenyl-3-methyl-5-hydroxy-6-metoxy-1,4-benzoquinol methylase
MAAAATQATRFDLRSTMPTIDDNVRCWNEQYEWAEEGDSWSKAWGGASSQWFGTVLPRLKSFVPAPTILEVAPGFGRWTQFLRPLCTELILVDISAKCIDACRRRFSAYQGIAYHVNDGRSLEMLEDGSIDFAFSFDSLVHVESDVLVGYFAQLAQKLKPDGVAFIHHSNLGEYVDPATGRLRPGVENRHWRAPSVSAGMVREACGARGLMCVSQEMINWGGNELNDAFTVAALPASRWARECTLMRNAEFMREANYLSRLAALYDWGPVTRGSDGPPSGRSA